MGCAIACLDRLAEGVSTRRDPLLGPATLALTQIRGGIGRNIIPPSSCLVVDRRLLPDETPENAQREIETALKQLHDEDPDFKHSVELLSRAESSATPVEEEIVKVALNSRSEVLNEYSQAAGFGACCDMRFLRNQGQVPSVVLGPGSLSLAHKIDEFIPIDEYLQAVKLYGRIVSNWF
jgi:acetylornithine deacetylase/succinyl-diaminopimelate desuccinylase-like protein